jgi:hypothetical protein
MKMGKTNRKTNNLTENTSLVQQKMSMSMFMLNAPSNDSHNTTTQPNFRYNSPIAHIPKPQTPPKPDVPHHPPSLKIPRQLPTRPELSKDTAQKLIYMNPPE